MGCGPDRRRLAWVQRLQTPAARFGVAGGGFACEVLGRDCPQPDGCRAVFAVTGHAGIARGNLINSLSQNETRALLSDMRTGRLGCVVDGGPYVVPVNYVFHEDSIYVHSLLGRKINALRANPRACL